MDGGGGTGKGRAALVALALLAVVTVPLALWGASSDGDGGDELVVEMTRAAGRGPAQIVVSFRDANAIGGETPRGQLRVECHDAAGQRVVSSPVAYPLDTDGGRLPPHTHFTATSEQADRVTRCSLIGFETTYEGRVR